MIKNGRPYTNENGFTDGALITGREDAVVTAVDGWIRKNIRAGKKVLQGHTSYGMKNMIRAFTLPTTSSRTPCCLPDTGP